MADPVRLSIPPLTTKLRLAQPWRFPLYRERRNASLVAAVAPGKAPEDRYGYFRGDVNVVAQVTLPVGTILSVDRIYIRRGLKGYDSVTFRITDAPQKDLKGCRFWAKLADVNRIICEPVDSSEDNKAAFQTFAMYTRDIDI